MNKTTRFALVAGIALIAGVAGFLTRQHFPTGDSDATHEVPSAAREVKPLHGDAGLGAARSIGDLFLAEVLVSTVIVQRDDARQRPGRSGRTQYPRLDARPEPDRPRHGLAVDPVGRPALVDPDVTGRVHRFREGENLAQARPGFGAWGRGRKA